ncbi:hypothetical protein N7528_003229 [Penicillium herquei]|nr:hypothetical protein N7528_003229 [Penicillium herquei]
MKYQTPTLLALNQNTGVACNWTSAAQDCNLLRQYKDTRPVLSENPSNGLAESKSAKSLLRRSTEKLISKANLRHRPRPIGKHSSIPSFTANPGFAQFLREHSSPKHHRVTAGGRIVPMQPVDRTMSAEGQETPDGQRGFQNINMQQTPQGYMTAPPSQQGWQPLPPLAHQIQHSQYQGNTFNPPNPHPSFNLYYSVGTPAHNPETGTQSNGNSFPMDPANQAGLVFWNNAQTSLIATPDALAHFAATVMNEIENSMVNLEQMRSLQFNLIQHRLNVQEALDQANIAIAWTQVTQPIQRDLRITYINMRNVLDEAIGILESRMQLIHTSTMPVHYGVGQPTGTNMSPPPEYSFVNQAASGQTNMNWEVSSNSGISVSHIELADVDPQTNWEVSSNSGVSVAHIESADMEPQANTANEMQFNSQYDDDTAFMGSSRLEWSPKRNLRADDSDGDHESDLEDLQHNQLDGTCSEEGMRRASDDELSPRRSSGFRVNKAQIEGPSKFSWFSWPGNFLETDYDALLGGGHDIEPELAKAQRNWGKNSMRGKPFEEPFDSDQDEDRDGNETESECCGEDLAQNAPPLSRRGSKSGEADNDINDSLTSDEWTIFLSPPRYSHRLRSSPTVSSEVNKM